MGAELVTGQLLREGSVPTKQQRVRAVRGGAAAARAWHDPAVSPVPNPLQRHPSALFKVHLNPEALDMWNALPPRTRGSLEKQLSGMAMLIGFRDLLTDGERY